MGRGPHRQPASGDPSRGSAPPALPSSWGKSGQFSGGANSRLSRGHCPVLPPSQHFSQASYLELSCVTPGKCLNLSVPGFLICNMGLGQCLLLQRCAVSMAVFRPISAQGTRISHASPAFRGDSELWEGKAQVCLTHMAPWPPWLTFQTGCGLLEATHEPAWGGVFPWRTWSGPRGAGRARGQGSWKSARSPAVREPSPPPRELGGGTAVPRAARCRQ